MSWKLKRLLVRLLRSLFDPPSRHRGKPRNRAADAVAGFTTELERSMKNGRP